jgi:hypothetical protein
MNMKQLFFDLVKEAKALRSRLDRLNEKYNEFCFEDMFLCDLILDEHRRTQVRLDKCEKAMAGMRDLLTKDELKAWSKEFNAVEVVA